jgi:hypothetical protein
MGKFKIIVIASIIFITLISCGRREYTEEGINEIKREIDSLLYTAEGEKFDWGSGKAYSYFTAYFDESGEMIFINEDFRYRKSGTSFNRYYFSYGNVISFIGREMIYVPEKQQKNIDVLINPDGDVIVYDKIINGKRENLSNDEAEEIVNHARELRDIVEKRMTAKK